MFTQVWHYLFGAANRILAEQGMFLDPYAGDRTQPGFVPAVWHDGIDQLER
ncbi:MAG: hypothetical protein GWM93_07065 [Gemmatimonadetes bacterium]|nr:hypothetical protein [Gemmatimonadota bacterium]NIT66435.1 hypothetical protein [Gemmatimonadota bacterium]NIY35012.1 hypothetical protein [Gemmatimonadota bacterium]